MPWRFAAVGRSTTALALVLLAGCGGSGDPAGPSTPRTPVPQELVGGWITGSVAATNFHDPDTGAWQNGYGNGLFYRFTADGGFEYGWQAYAANGSCVDRAMVYKRGTVTVDIATRTVRTHPTYSRVHGENSCNPSYNYDKPGPTAVETLIWAWAEDQYGNVYLLLRSPTSDFSWFRPS
ncbi:MAG TPA: hypothetical protein VNK43_13545 [Gemmatimonadales bacterium]|nr:hypothetical protein [Gemmatimonadales bacterium]